MSIPILREARHILFAASFFSFSIFFSSPIFIPSSLNCWAMVCMIAATTRNLSALIQVGSFRYDLYNHLKAHEIFIPPLRERKEDIPLLLDHFLGKAALNAGIEKPVLPGDLMTFLENYNFPGNVGELKRMVNSAVSKHQSGILSTDAFLEN